MRGCASLLLLALSGFAAALDRDIKHIDASTPSSVQVELAKLAAPREVSDAATIYVLGAHGYEKAINGTNGFSCLIERELLNTMEPECYDAVGSTTTLRVRVFVEAQRASGKSEDDIEHEVQARYKNGKFKAPHKAGICYMLSDYNYVFDPDAKTIIHFPGHLMFYAPYATRKTIGSGEGAPYLVHPGEPDTLMIVVPASNGHGHHSAN
jgi:hypothetical protein